MPDQSDQQARITAALRLVNRSEGRCLECLGLIGIPEEELLRACWHAGDELPRYRLLHRACDKCGRKGAVLRKLHYR